MQNQASRGRFVWHELMTSDPAAAQSFYKHVVGWGTSKWDSSSIDYTMWTADEAPVGGVMPIPQEAAAMGAPPNWLAYVEVPDVDATVVQATTLGATVLSPAQTIPDVGRFAVLRDPQGAVFAVITSENPIPDETDPKQREFSWHELVTENYKAADAFYNTLFGWETKDDVDMGPIGVYHMFGRDRFTYGGMFNKPADMPAPPHWMPYVQVDSADDAAERATKAGGTVINGPMEVPGGDRIATIVDPQGAVFSVHSKKA
jgi:predicted enzyme related to lactoylglutathione lyase